MEKRKIEDGKNLNKFIFILFVTLFFLNGCVILPGIALRNDEVNRFVGKTELDLIRHYGQPIDVRYNGKGRKILVFEWRYEETIHEPARIYTDSSGRVTSYRGAYTRTERYLERRKFTIDKKGKVIQGTWKFY